jgi:hypothetical protein
LYFLRFLEEKKTHGKRLERVRIHAEEIFLLSTYRLATNFNVSSSKTTGKDIFKTANHSSHVKAQI